MDTFKSIRDAVLASIDETGDTSTTKTVVDNAINEAHQRRCSSYNWSWMLWPQAETITLTASQQYYSLHEQVDRIVYLYNRTTKTYLKALPFRNIEPLGQNVLDATTGEKFHFIGLSPVENQPSSSSVITIVSTSAADTGASYAVKVRGETATGIQTETINPNGTTPAAGSVSFTRILGVTLTAAWAGRLTMTSNSAAVTNLTLNAGEYGRQFPQIFLTWSPSSADVLEYKFYRKPFVLTNDYDIPDIPFPYSKILVYDALLEIAAYNGQMDGARVRHWERKQMEIEMQMFAAHDPTIVGASARSVREINDFEAI